MIILIYISVFIAVLSAVLVIAEAQKAYSARSRLGIIKEKKIEGTLLVNWTRPLWKSISPHLKGLKCRMIRNKLSSQLVRAGLSENLSVDDLFAYQIVTTVIFAFLSFNLPVIPQGWLTTVVFTIVGFFFPVIWLNGFVKKRCKEIVFEMPNVVDLITLSVEAGLDFMAALTRVAENSRNTPLILELKRMVDEVRIGVSRSDALKNLAERVKIPAISSFSALLIQADRLGASVGPVLRAQSEKMRTDRFQRAERAGSAAAQKLLFPLVFCIIPAVFIVIFGPVIVKFVTEGVAGLF